MSTRSHNKSWDPTHQSISLDWLQSHECFHTWVAICRSLRPDPDSKLSRLVLTLPIFPWLNRLRLGQGTSRPGRIWITRRIVTDDIFPNWKESALEKTFKFGLDAPIPFTAESPTSECPPCPIMIRILKWYLPADTENKDKVGENTIEMTSNSNVIRWEEAQSDGYVGCISDISNSNENAKTC